MRINEILVWYMLGIRTKMRMRVRMMVHGYIKAKGVLTSRDSKLKAIATLYVGSVRRG